jgi:hypothetical protein
MPYNPPGYTGIKPIEAGIHLLRLDELKAVDAAKANCSVCYLAIYKNAEGAEVQDWMKWGANPIADKIASERMDALLGIAGLPENSTLDAIVTALASVPLEVEVVQNGRYFNVFKVGPASLGATGSDDIPF